MFVTARMLWQAVGIISRQRDLIASQQTDIEALRQGVRDAELAYMRIGRDLIEQFLICLDKPEVQEPVRDRLTMALGFYRDEIAVREEHV